MSFFWDMVESMTCKVPYNDTIKSSENTRLTMAQAGQSFAAVDMRSSTPPSRNEMGHPACTLNSFVTVSFNMDGPLVLIIHNVRRQAINTGLISFVPIRFDACFSLILSVVA